MDFLLDTHTFIWFINGDDHLPKKVVDQIENIKNKCFFSIASIWEIAIKTNLNKLRLNIPFDQIREFCTQNNIELLPISFEHIQSQNKLDFHHRDPFDRLIIAQGITEKLTILTKDENFRLYNVKCLW